MPLAPRFALASLLALTGCAQVVFEGDPTGSGGAAPVAAVATTTDTSASTSGAGGAAACASDLASDPRNCGTCGHDCLGGACEGGVCQPVLLATQSGQPWEIALDGAYVYWSNTAGPISRVPKQGGATSVLTSDLVNPGQLSVFGGRVYSASMYGAVASVSTSGGALVPLTPPIMGGLAAAAGPTGVHWVTEASAQGERYVVHTGFDGAQTAVLAAGQHEPTALAVDDTHAYWTDYVDDDSGDGGLRRVPLAGGPVETLALHRSLVSLALDEDHVYALFGGTPERSWGDGALLAIPKGGGDPQVLASDLAGTGRVAVDATHVYWTEAYSYLVRRAPKHGGDAETLATAASGTPLGIAVDEEAVYWVDPSARTVMKVAK